MRYLSLIFLTLLIPSLVFAGTIEDGKSALDRKDYPAALKLLRPLAEGGNTAAQLYIGQMYVDGWGVERDMSKALSWYRKAAKLGNADAQYRLGVMYLGIPGVKKDEAESEKWLQKASEQGDPDAQLLISLRKSDEEKDKEGCNPCSKTTVWDDYNVFNLKVTFMPKPDFAQWSGSFDKASHDISIEYSGSDGKNADRVKLIMIGGRALVTHDLVGNPEGAYYLLEAEVLQMMVVKGILGRAFPNGSKDIPKDGRLNYTSEKLGIQYATPGSQGFVAAPWHALGNIKVIAPASVEFDMELTQPVKNRDAGNMEKSVTKYSGDLSFRDNTRIDDSMSLREWKIEGLSDSEAVKYKTVADVRKKIADEEAKAKLAKP
jgi:hypothetical protein